MRPERGLLDTAWSIQALRGVALYLVLLAAAAPLASWYGEPLLVAMLSIAGGQLVFEGFQSTGTLRGDASHGDPATRALEVLVQISAIAFMISFAWLQPSVWALVWGGLASSAVRLVASHWMFPRRRARLRWDAGCVQNWSASAAGCCRAPSCCS